MYVPNNPCILDFSKKKNYFDNQRRFWTYRLCIYKSIMNNIIVQRNFKRKFPQKRWKVEIFLRLSGSVYVPNKTVNRGNFSKYIDRVYTIIWDSRVCILLVYCVFKGKNVVRQMISVYLCKQDRWWIITFGKTDAWRSSLARSLAFAFVSFRCT